MISDVEQITKNLRYKVLDINGSPYILDMDRNGWVFLFPFLFWLLPHRIFKIDQMTVGKINIQEISREGTLTALGAGGLAIILGNLIEPVVNYLEIETTIMVKLITLLILLAPVIWIRFRISNMNQKKLLKTIYLQDLQTEKVRIRPESTQYMIKHLLIYLFCWAFVIVVGSASIVYGNILILIISVAFFFIILMLNHQVIRAGKAKIKFVQ